MSTDTVIDKVTHSIWNQVQYSADLCIKCNICTSHCPVTNVTDLFPGPKFVGPQAQRFRNPKDISVDASVDYCSGCGVCSMVCPHGVKVMEMNAKASGTANSLMKTSRTEHCTGWPGPAKLGLAFAVLCVIIHL